MSNVPVTPAVVLYQGIRDILLSAKKQARRAVNDAMVQWCKPIGMWAV